MKGGLWDTLWCKKDTQVSNVEYLTYDIERVK